MGVEQDDQMRKSFKAGCVSMAEYFLISIFSVWVVLCVVHSLCSSGVPPVILEVSFLTLSGFETHCLPSS